MQAIFRAAVQPVATILLVAVALGYAAPWSHALDLFGHFRLHLLVLCAPVLVLAFATLHWSAAWRTLVAAVLAAAGLGPVWEGSGPGFKGEAISVLTANLHHNNERSAEMIRALKAANADVLVTNETTTAALSGGEALSDIYPHRLSLRTKGRILRTVIWSKYPMRDGRLMLEDAIEPTGAAAIIQLPDGREFSVLGLHLAHAWPGNQSRQIAVLGQITAALPRPLIVMGDFNAEPWSHALRRVQLLTGTGRVPGYRVTWRGAYPSPLGQVPAFLGHAIDHVLVSPDIKIKRVILLDIPGSDHDAVGAFIRLPDP